MIEINFLKKIYENATKYLFWIDEVVHLFILMVLIIF